MFKRNKSQYNAVSISHDLTKSGVEREQNQKMVAGVKEKCEKENLGNKMYMIVAPYWARKITLVEIKRG